MLEHAPLADILGRARTAGIGKMLTVSTERANWEKNRDLALAHDGIYYSIGLHPHEAKHWPQVEADFHTFFPGGEVLPKCVAIGEIGLDFHYGFSSRDEQIAALEAQIAFAKKCGLPVILHCRDAFPELFASIGKIGLAPRGGVMHCFTGNEPQAKDAIALGLKISFSGILTFKTATALRDAAKTLPLSELLLETDCPYLTPMPHRGKPNEPSYLPLTAKVLADTLGLDEATVARETTANAARLFALS